MGITKSHIQGTLKEKKIHPQKTKFNNTLEPRNDAKQFFMFVDGRLGIKFN